MELLMESLCMFLLGFIMTHSRGSVTVELSPSNVSQVCVGQQSELTCTTNGSFILWNFMLTNDQGIFRMYDRIISLVDPSQQASYLLVNSTSFNLTRSSTQNSSPLTSSLLITVGNGTPNTLNGTQINCTGIMGNTRMSTLTTIHVVENIHIDSPEVNVSMQFQIQGVLITLDWIPQVGVTYNVTTTPAIDVRFFERASANLSLSYNTAYNVTVEATSLCKETNTTLKEFNYSKCQHFLPSVADDSVAILEPAIVGTTVTFFCPHGFTLTGTNTSTCTQSGKWEPNTTDVYCKPEPQISTNESTAIITSEVVSEGNINEISFGTVGGFLCLLLIIFLVVVCTALLIRRKGLYTVRKKQHRNMNDEQTSHSCYQINREETLVYADIGPSFKMHPTPISRFPAELDLDDNRVEYAQLNYKHKVQNSQESLPRVIESQRKDDHDIHNINLDTLLIQLRRQVTSKWYQFGEAVGIDKEVLDNYARNCCPEDCIVEMLDYWLRKHVNQPTWREIADTLKLIGLYQLASDIEKVYSTGKLPVETDMDEIPQALFSTEAPPPIPPKKVTVNGDPLVPLKVLDTQSSRDRRLPKSKPPPPLPPEMLSTINVDHDILVDLPPRPPKS